MSIGRFFSEDSFWNQPIPEDAQSDPRSEHLIGLMNERQGPIYINCHEYTIPAYVAGPDTPPRTVYQRGPEPDAQGRALERQRRYAQHPDFGPLLPIPAEAIPDPARDAHMAIVDVERGIAWDMWHVRIREDGEYESCTGMYYRLDSQGVWRTADFPINNGESLHFYGPSRAAGVPAIAGLVMQWEIEQGHIEHKLAFATNNALQRFVPPAAWTDGAHDDGPVEGCVLQLDPTLNLDSFNLSAAARAIARALQEYGAVDVDGAQGNVVYVEGLYGHPGRSWEGILDPDDLRCIPLRHYRILKLEHVVGMGDEHWHSRTEDAARES